MPRVLLMPLALWQLAQSISANRLPSAISIGAALSVRMASPGLLAADCACAPGPSPALAAPATAAHSRRLLRLRCIAVHSSFGSVSPRPFRNGRWLRSPLLRRQARVIGRDAFDDGIAIGHAHVVHQRVSTLAITIGPQRQDQIILVLGID